MTSLYSAKQTGFDSTLNAQRRGESLTSRYAKFRVSQSWTGRGCWLIVSFLLLLPLNSNSQGTVNPPKPWVEGPALGIMYNDRWINANISELDPVDTILVFG